MLIHKQDDPNDHGVTLPTTLIPSSGGDDWRGFIRFEGLSVPESTRALLQVLHVE